MFGKGRDMQTMAHSDFKCLTRKCLMETMSHYVFEHTCANARCALMRHFSSVCDLAKIQTRKKFRLEKNSYLENHWSYTAETYTQYRTCIGVSLKNTSYTLKSITINNLTREKN